MPKEVQVPHTVSKIVQFQQSDAKFFVSISESVSTFSYEFRRTRSIELVQEGRGRTRPGTQAETYKGNH